MGTEAKFTDVLNLKDARVTKTKDARRKASISFE
jgi:hypothetical protein